MEHGPSAEATGPWPGAIQKTTNDSIAAIHCALDLGVNWIDTAAVYGLGHSEEVVARALKTTSHKPYVFTKSTLVWDEKAAKVGDSQKQAPVTASAKVIRHLQVDPSISTGPPGPTDEGASKRPD